MAGLPTPIKPSIPTPTVQFPAYTSRRTQDIMAAGPYILPQGDLISGGGFAPPIPPTSPQIVTQMGGFVNKLRNPTFDIWQRGNQIMSALSTWTYGPDGWLQYWHNTEGFMSRTSGRGLSLYALQLSNTSGIYGQNMISQRIGSQIACGLGGQNCTFQAQIFNGIGGSDFIPNGVHLSIGHPSVQDGFTTAITWDVNSVKLQPCLSNQWTQVAYTFNLPMASAQLGIVVQLDFGQAINIGNVYINITECDLRATPDLTVGLLSNPPTPEFRPYTLEMLLSCIYYQTVQQLPMFYGAVTSGQTYYSASEFVTPMRVAPVINAIDVQDSNFPAGPPTISSISANGFRAYKIASATAPTGFFIYGYTATAEL